MKTEQTSLDEVIVEVLEGQRKPLTNSQIHRIIVEKGLWFRPSDGKPPGKNQITARTGRKGIFMVVEREVSLASWHEDKRLLRLAWNEFGWEKPSGHRWYSRKQGDGNTAYENQYGYGAEEWLFNARYNLEGFQYGYIKGLAKLSSIDFVNEAFLFTIDPKTKNRFLIGKIRNIEILDAKNLSKHVEKLFDKYHGQMIEEVLEVGGDISDFEKPNYPVVRFQMTDSEIFERKDWLLVNEIAGGKKFNRYNPYHLPNSIETIFIQKFRSTGFQFVAGKRKSENASHSRTRISGRSEIEGLHAQIIDELEVFLEPEYQITRKNISIEKSSFGGNLADIVLQHADSSISIIEVKTSSNSRKNIREAIGQLMDYGCWDSSVKVRKLIIVSPSSIKKDIKGFLKRIDRGLKFELEYLQFYPDPSLKVKFEKLEF